MRAGRHPDGDPRGLAEDLSALHDGSGGRAGGVRAVSGVVDRRRGVAGGGGDGHERASADELVVAHGDTEVAAALPLGRRRRHPVAIE